MNNKKALKRIFNIIIMISFIFMLLSMIVLFIDIKQNKGIVPFIFIFSTIFYLFSNYEYIIPNENNTLRKVKEKTDFVFKLLNLFGFILSIIFFLMSYYVFWA